MTTLFNQPLNVINVGIALFSDDLKKQHVPVTQLDWAPPGQGNMQIVEALDRQVRAVGHPFPQALEELREDHARVALRPR